MRPVHVMLLGSIVLWALNLTLTRYILQHGFDPLSYATVRYGLASVIFVGIVLVAERSLAVARRDLLRIVFAAFLLYLNQLGFVFALDTTSASTIALLLGATPVFAALIGLALGLERLSRRFWLASLVSFAGVALVALGGSGNLSGDLRGDLLGLLAASTWAGYSVTIAPLMERYSASRISALVLPLTWAAVAVTGIPQTAGQDFGVSWQVWTLLVVATLGPLVLTTILWFRVLHEIGPSRATLAANLQPFVSAIFALVLLSEAITVVQVLGGALIAAGILLARRRTAVPIPE